MRWCVRGWVRVRLLSYFSLVVEHMQNCEVIYESMHAFMSKITFIFLLGDITYAKLLRLSIWIFLLEDLLVTVAVGSAFPLASSSSPPGLHNVENQTRIRIISPFNQNQNCIEVW